MVEQLTVNQPVVGSNPTLGANKENKMEIILGIITLLVIIYFKYDKIINKKIKLIINNLDYKYRVKTNDIVSYQRDEPFSFYIGYRGHSPLFVCNTNSVTTRSIQYNKNMKITNNNPVEFWKKEFLTVLKLHNYKI